MSRTHTLAAAGDAEESSRVAGSRWLAGGRAREGSLRRLADAVSVVEALRGRRLDNQAIVVAVNSSWVELGGARPADLVSKGGVADILRAVRQRYPRPKPRAAPSAEASLADALLALAAAAQASVEALQREFAR